MLRLETAPASAANGQGRLVTRVLSDKTDFRLKLGALAALVVALLGGGVQLGRFFSGIDLMHDHQEKLQKGQEEISAQVRDLDSWLHKVVWTKDEAAEYMRQVEDANKDVPGFRMPPVIK